MLIVHILTEQQVTSSCSLFPWSHEILLGFIVNVALVPNIASYIKDTNDFLRKLKNVGTLPDGAILFTIDVVGLYPHIPHDEGLQALREAPGTF